MPFDESDRRGGEGCDGAFHVGDAAAVDRALGELRAEGIEAPARGVSRRHDVGMAGKDEMRRRCPDPGVEILNVGRAGFGKNDPLRCKTRRFQTRLQHVLRAGVIGRHGRTPHQGAAKLDGRGCYIRHFASALSHRLEPADLQAERLGFYRSASDFATGAKRAG